MPTAVKVRNKNAVRKDEGRRLVGYNIGNIELQIHLGAYLGSLDMSCDSGRLVLTLSKDCPPHYRCQVGGSLVIRIHGVQLVARWVTLIMVSYAFPVWCSNAGISEVVMALAEHGQTYQKSTHHTRMNQGSLVYPEQHTFWEIGVIE